MRIDCVKKVCDVCFNNYGIPGKYRGLFDLAKCEINPTKSTIMFRIRLSPVESKLRLSDSSPDVLLIIS